MASGVVAERMELMWRAVAPFMEAVVLGPIGRMPRDRPVADFAAGNPQEGTLPEFLAALQRWSVPQHTGWFAYAEPNRPARAVAAAALRERLDLPFEPDDVFLARGASGGLAMALQAVLDPGDEAIFLSPPWFFYEGMILAAGGVPVRVRVDPRTYDLDVPAIAAALGPRTRAVVVNTPNNPTGKIYPPATLERLAAALTEASSRHGQPIYLISDEAYSRILFDGRLFHTPGRFYPRTLLLHTYSKSALAPGQRLGYVALAPGMPDRDRVGGALMLAGMMSGAGMPDAVMQYALPDIEPLSIDLAHLQRKRDRVVAALRGYGYELHVPEATFYLLPRSPLSDDVAFAARLAERDVYVLPGRAVEMPGHFRVSLTATDAMIDQALPVFADAIAQVSQPA
jgi:aspartate aminotransferase